MKRVICFLIFGLIGVGDIALAAERLVVTPQEIQQIGVETSAPAVATEVRVANALALVVLPPNNDTALSSPLSGKIVQLGAALGDQVVVGQVLAEIQSADFLTLQRDYLAAHFANVVAKSQHKRDLALYGDGIIAERRLQQTLATAQTTQARHSEASQLLTFAGMDLVAIEKLSTEQNLQPTLQLRTPVTGTVIDRLMNAGAYVETASPLYRVADLSTLWLEIQVPEEQSAAIAIGMRVALVDHGNTSAFVTSVSQAVDPLTQTVAMRATIEDNVGRLKPGQFVSANILSRTLTADRSIWSVPIGAVVHRGQATYVFTQSESGFDVRPVSVIASDSHNAYITSGIDANSRVVSIGVSVLKALWASVHDSAS